MAKENTWRIRKYSKRLTMDMVTGKLETTTLSTTFRDEYEDYIRSDAWFEKRRERLLIDNHTCVDCGSKQHLEVHHKTYVRFRHELMDDLVTLCDGCHKVRHLPLLLVTPREYRIGE